MPRKAHLHSIIVSEFLKLKTKLLLIILGAKTKSCNLFYALKAGRAKINKY